ncbi:DNA-binding domain-containing protein [Microbulbifer magnicolonia]|uniref:HvfC family RiPP maturation protein n=1 Tax=Microbulbifer magnicolonia TaxID=3109744 RepID=UPI002B4039FB|nr:putative DNA-binding domain-containing protein [Microbulbifer sp. GG15]
MQRAFAAHLRAPDRCAPPPSIEDRRMGIYRDLIYNNIESFIAGGFPVLRSLFSDSDGAGGDERWHEMVRDFVYRHASRSPYFLQISEEFLHYLQHERGPRAGDPPFLLELAHYEWVELALDVSEAEMPSGLLQDGDVLERVPVVSPLVWSLSYAFPVHRIGPAYQPQEPPPTPTFLLVYRDRDDEVGFMEINAVTARLLQLAEGGESSGRRLLEKLAQEMPQGMQQSSGDELVEFGRQLLEKLLRLGVIAGLRH